MEIKKVPTHYQTVYIANDGVQWDNEQQCKQYEALLKDPSPLKNLLFYNGEGERIDIFALKKIPHFCYLVLSEPLKETYDYRVIKVILGAKYQNDDNSYQLPTTKGIWYNDWSEALSGGYGFNGWEKEPSIATLEYQITTRQEQIKLLKKISKTS